MNAGWRPALRAGLACAGLLLVCGLSGAAEPAPFADLPARMGKELSTHQDWAPALRVAMVLTLLSLIPALLIATTAFLRILVVLVLLRHAIGLQDAPPNMAVVIVALFMTLFAMLPTLNEIDHKAWRPYMEDRMTLAEAAGEGTKPLREFMLRQTREQDLSLVVELSKAPTPRTEDEIGLLQLIPAFMLSELRTAFQIGFIIFLPFVVVDLVVSSVLAALGMMMVPPVLISLPLKILLFVLIDGWNLVARAVVGSFQ